MKKPSLTKINRLKIFESDLQKSFVAWQARVRAEIDRANDEIKKLNASAERFFSDKVHSFKDKINELIADADGKLRAELSAALQEKILPNLTAQARDTMMSEEWMTSVVQKATDQVYTKIERRFETFWNTKTLEAKNLAPTIFLEYIKSVDFITKVVAQVNALQLRKDVEKS